MAEATDDRDTQFAALLRQYQSRLMTDAMSFAALRQRLEAPVTRDTHLVMAEIVLAAHRLHGSAAAFGYAEIGSAAGELEELGRQWLGDHDTGSPGSVEAIVALLDKLTLSLSDFNRPTPA